MAQKEQSITEPKLGPKAIAELVRMYIKIQRPVYIHGQPGIGKSDIINQIGKDLGRDVYDVRLLLMTETDIRGIPYFNSTSGKMEWAPPATFPLEEDSNAILFLDEISQASPSVQAAALQLVLDRKIGDFELPAGVSIVAAGNSASDRTGAKALITALRNRFAHVHMKSDFEDWQEWAIAAKVHPDVIGFLSANKKYLNEFDKVTTQNSFATPRSWVKFVSDPLKSGEVSDAMRPRVVTAAVGSTASALYCSLATLVSNLPKVEDILNARATDLGKIDEQSKVAACFSLTTNCAYTLSDRLTDIRGLHDGAEKDAEMDKWFTSFNNFFKFVDKNMDVEIGTMALLQCMKVYKFPVRLDKLPSMKKWIEENRRFFTQII